MREIVLSNRRALLAGRPPYVVLVDDNDYAGLSEFKWYAVMPSGRVYAARGTPSMLMHRIIMGSPEGMDVDHIDGNSLNNQRANLRVCTRSENLHNTRAHRDGVSKYKGVWFERGKWRARIMADGRSHNIGYYANEIDAAAAYARAAAQLHGEFIHSATAELIGARA